MTARTVLLVDSDTRSARVLEVSLRKAGFVVSTAPTLAEGSAMVDRAMPDVVILETELPDGDGTVFAKRLKSSSSPPAGVVFLARDASPAAKIAAISAGADDFLAKPILVKDIVARLRALLDRSQAESLTRRERPANFSGTLGGMGLVDLFQLLETGKKSCILHLASDPQRSGGFVAEGEERARIYVRDGQPIDAEVGRLRGEAAIYRLLLWNDGVFEIEFTSLSRQAMIHASTQSVLLEGMRQVDEWSRLEGILPPLSTRLQVDYPALGARAAVMPPEVESMLRLFDGKRSLLSVLNESPLDDLGTLNIIAKLFEDSVLIDPRERSHASPPAGASPTLAAWLSTPKERTRPPIQNDTEITGLPSILGQVMIPSQETASQILSAAAMPELAAMRVARPRAATPSPIPLDDSVVIARQTVAQSEARAVHADEPIMLSEVEPRVTLRRVAPVLSAQAEPAAPSPRLALSVPSQDRERQHEPPPPPPRISSPVEGTASRVPAYRSLHPSQAYTPASSALAVPAPRAQTRPPPAPSPSYESLAPPVARPSAHAVASAPAVWPADAPTEDLPSRGRALPPQAPQASHPEIPAVPQPRRSAPPPPPAAPPEVSFVPRPAVPDEPRTHRAPPPIPAAEPNDPPPSIAARTPPPLGEEFSNWSKAEPDELSSWSRGPTYRMLGIIAAVALGLVALIYVIPASPPPIAPIAPNTVGGTAKPTRPAHAAWPVVPEEAHLAGNSTRSAAPRAPSAATPAGAMTPPSTAPIAAPNTAPIAAPNTAPIAAPNTAAVPPAPSAMIPAPSAAIPAATPPATVAVSPSGPPKTAAPTVLPPTEVVVPAPSAAKPATPAAVVAPSGALPAGAVAKPTTPAALTAPTAPSGAAPSGAAPTAAGGAQLEAGEAALKASKMPAAETAFQKVVDLDPNNGAAYAGLAMAQYQRQKDALAKKAASRALELDPSAATARAHIVLGLLANDRGDVRTAKVELQTYLKLAPGGTDAPEIKKFLDALH